MYILTWAFDNQSDIVNHVVGSIRATLELYGVLWAEKERLSFAEVREVGSPDTIREWNKID